MQTDEELMLIYREGEAFAFEELYRRYRARVYGYLHKKVPGEEKDDVFQKIFLKLHQKRHLFNSDYPFAPWFFTLCRHVVIDHYRCSREVVSMDQVEDLTSPGSELDFQELPEMEADHFKLLYAKFVEGKGYKELEAEFSASSSALRKRVSRLLATLRGEA